MSQLKSIRMIGSVPIMVVSGLRHVAGEVWLEASNQQSSTVLRPWAALPD
eukprot:gene19849-7314_t